MTRYRYTKRQGGARSEIRSQAGVRVPTRQATLQTGSIHKSEAQAQRQLDRWDAGTAALEARMAKARAKAHDFVPMGSLPACERCGVGRDAVLDGKRVHR